MMELWHLGLCLLCLVIGLIAGVVVDVEDRSNLMDEWYELGYKHGKEDGREERD